MMVYRGIQVVLQVLEEQMQVVLSWSSLVRHSTLCLTRVIVRLIIFWYNHLG